nr:putative ribonuclease H-like domain-containing protein [Tanacetum cinerariifolium]
MNDLLDDNNFFIFDDESVKISPVRKMYFRKKPLDSMNVRSKSNSNKSLPRTVHKWLPKLQPLSRIVFGNRALLTNFVEKFLGTVLFDNNDFAVIAGFGDVVIGSMMIKKVYYVKDGVDLLTGDRLSNFYTIALNEAASNSSTCLLAKASSSQSWLWHQVQRVRTDNGTEFKNKTLAKFFDEVGITQQFSAARTPQQNGVVERRN